MSHWICLGQFTTPRLRGLNASQLFVPWFMYFCLQRALLQNQQVYLSISASHTPKCPFQRQFSIQKLLKLHYSFNGALWKSLVMYICNGADLSWYPLPTICQTMLGKQTSKLQKNNWNKFLYWNKFQKSVKILLHFLHVTHFYSLLTRYYSATVAYNNRRIRKLVMIFILWIPKCSYPCRKSNLQVPQR